MRFTIGKHRRKFIGVNICITKRKNWKQISIWIWSLWKEQQSVLEIRKNIELINTKAGFLGKKIDKSLSYLLKEKQKIHHKEITRG